MKVYGDEYARTGFQGGLQWYRCRTEGIGLGELQIFSGQSIGVPSLFISGRSDWGNYQTVGAIERMQGTGCSDLRGVHQIEGAGHWVQQEKPNEVGRLLLELLAATRT